MVRRNSLLQIWPNIWICDLFGLIINNNVIISMWVEFLGEFDYFSLVFVLRDGVGVHS
jgi:hypothetical protein